MLFDSYLFIFFFLPATLFGYFLCTRYKQYRLAIYWLTLASLFFYGWWNPSYLILLLLSIFVNYGFGLVLYKRAARYKNNGRILFLGIFLNLTFIGYFKYAYFLVSNLNVALGTAIPFDPVILPLGISFFTFQKIAFLVDASKGDIKNYHFADYSLFVTFFPQLIAGPIVQHKQMMPQLANPDQLNVNAKNFNIGMTLFLIGLFKKIVLADGFALYANAVFDAAHQAVQLSFFEAWGGALSYALQLYFDFSGYSDMAVGLAYLFGITLPLNFYSPYKAKNIIDFWHRWHMTLSRFLRDYLYIPLGGNRKGSLRRYINLMITMLLGGLWHGANWTFVLWGGMHGFFLMINHISQKLGISLGRVASHFLTFTAIVAAWVPFRADNVQEAKAILCSMLSLESFTLPKTLADHYHFIAKLAEIMGLKTQGMFYNGLADWYVGMIWIVGGLFVVFFMPNSIQLMGETFRSTIETEKTIPQRYLWKPTTTWAFLMALLVLINIMFLSQQSEFLYFQF